jgi:hypothetical protein
LFEKIITMNKLRPNDEGGFYVAILLFIYLGYALFLIVSGDSFGTGLALLIFTPIVIFILSLIGWILGGIIGHYREIEDARSQKKIRLKEKVYERKTTTSIPNNITNSNSNSNGYFNNITTYSTKSVQEKIGYCRTCGKETEQCQYPYHYGSNRCIICNGGTGYANECDTCYRDQND